MRWPIVASALAACACAAAAAAQVPLNPLRPAQENVLPGAALSADSQLTLASVGPEFIELTHAAFPVSLQYTRDGRPLRLISLVQTHKVKIKETTGWCDPDVRSYSGYINTGHGRDLFFYFFESRSDPATDPVLTWINGGPGCSSSLGLFMELGPCTIADPGHINGTKRNPNSWNDRANVIFIEQPIGVSFSYGKHGQTTSSTEQAAVDIQAFVSIFFQTFNEFHGREYYMSGESYGGRYLPLFASAILDGNKALIKHGLEPVNLKGVLIGNGLTDLCECLSPPHGPLTDLSADTMLPAYYTYQCANLPSRPGQEAPINSIENCVKMARTLPICEEMLERECLYRSDKDACFAAMGYCATVVSTPFFDMKLNPWVSIDPVARGCCPPVRLTVPPRYDISMACTEAELADGLCYGEITHNITKYMDLPELRAFLGVDASAPAHFSSCSNKVYAAFDASLDESHKTWLYVTSPAWCGCPLADHGKPGTSLDCSRGTSRS